MRLTQAEMLRMSVETLEGIRAAITPPVIHIHGNEDLKRKIKTISKLIETKKQNGCI